MKLAIVALILAVILISGCVQSIPTLIKGEKISLDKDTAENIIKNYTEQYLEKMNMNFKIDKIEAEFGESNSGIIGLKHPAKPDKIFEASSYSGTILLSNNTINGTLRFLYDATAPFGFVCNREFCNIFVEGASCISDNNECVIGNDFHCENLMFEQDSVPEEISKYFNCICNKTGETSWTITNTTYNVSDYDTFCMLNQPIESSCGCKESKETGKYDCFIIKSSAIYTVRECSLDFSIKSKKSQDNKVILTINTPKDVPSVNIKGEECRITGYTPGFTVPNSECNKDCEEIINLKKGTNEIKTECDYTEPENSTWNCIRLFFNEYKIAEIGCRYFA